LGGHPYVATFTAQRLQLPWTQRPAAAGVLAVNLDLSLDPLAELLGYWSWRNVAPINYFGVPLDNFLGWFLIVSAFALTARAGFRLIPAGTWGRDVWVSPLSALVAVALTAAVQSVIGTVYEIVGEATVFVVVFAACTATTMGFALKSRRDNPKDGLMLGIPLAIHALILALFFLTGSVHQQPNLMVVIPLAALVGFFGFSWPSLSAWFPAPPP
jgi:hypothetical protein